MNSTSITCKQRFKLKGFMFYIVTWFSVCLSLCLFCNISLTTKLILTLLYRKASYMFQESFFWRSWKGVMWVIVRALSCSSGARWFKSTHRITKMWWFELPLHLTVRFYWLGWIKVGHLPLSSQGHVIMSELRWKRASDFQ